MLIGKVKSDFIYVVFTRHLVQYCEKIAVFEISKGNFAVIIDIKSEKYAHYHSISIAFLELRGSLQEFQPRMRVEQMLKKGFKIALDYVLAFRLGN